jgi:hypothetical protein
MGHSEMSDWVDKSPDDPVFGLYRVCGFWTHDEVSILYHVSKRMIGTWVDIGAHTGWTGAHLAMAGNNVWAVEPMFGDLDFYRRFIENITHVGLEFRVQPWAGRSDEFAAVHGWRKFTGVVVDGDHGEPNPLWDAQRAYSMEAKVVLFHDAIGGPVQQAARWLIERGYKMRVYNTPKMVICCWNTKAVEEGFRPPDHTPDPSIDWAKVRKENFFNYPWELDE